MVDLFASLRRPPEPTHDLVSIALKLDKLADLARILQFIAESVGAYGAILWEVRDVFAEADTSTEFTSSDLFAIAQWFDSGLTCSYRGLPMEHSITGEAIRREQSILSKDVWRDPRANRDDPFLRDAGITSIFSTPVRFVDSTRGALNLYWQSSPNFSSREKATIERLTLLIPELFRVLWDRVSFRLLQDVGETLRQAEVDPSATDSSERPPVRPFEKVAELVARAFGCVETSIFLQDPVRAPGVFNLVATTWPWPDEFEVPTYRLDDAGLTGWVLTHQRPLKLFDLLNLRQELPVIHRDYPGLVLPTLLGMEQPVRKYLNVDRNEALPPVSFMAVPITVGTRLQGVIRCSAAVMDRHAPYYFADRDLDLLRLVAEQVGQSWHNWLARRDARAEADSWNTMVASVKALNAFVYDELQEPEPNEARIFEEALRLLNERIQHADSLDVRMLDESTRELYYHTVYGVGWHHGDDREINMRKALRHSVDPVPARSAGAHVFQTGDLYVVNDPKNDPYSHPIFPEVKHQIIAPVSVAGTCYGVLDIRSVTGEAFSRHTESIAELLGRQLGLYHYLTATIGSLNRAERDLRVNRNLQSDTWKNLKHQLHGPIMQALVRVNAFLDAFPNDSIHRSRLMQIRGILRKANRVEMSTGLIADLSRGLPVEADVAPLPWSELVRMLIEAASDSEVLVDPYRRLRFHVDRSSIEKLGANLLEVDRGLIEQAVNSLLDNAGKYSFSQTTVRVSGGFTARNQFALSVTSSGLPVDAMAASQCKDWGWRGEEAKRVTGEGMGIGLWITDHIMKAHLGELTIVPTRPDGVTEFKLVFPISRR